MSQPYFVNAMLAQEAVRRGDIPALDLLFETDDDDLWRAVSDFDLLAQAVYHQQSEVMIWLLEAQIEPTEYAWVAAAHSGRQDLWTFLLDRYVFMLDVDMNGTPNAATWRAGLRAAALNQQVAMMDYLWKHIMVGEGGYVWRNDDREVVRRAAECGHVAVLAWYHKHLCPWFDDAWWMAALVDGPPTVWRWAVDHRLPHSLNLWSRLLLQNARHALQFLHTESLLPPGWQHDVALQSCHSATVVRWALAQGCAWPSEVPSDWMATLLSNAILNEVWDTWLWLRTHGLAARHGPGASEACQPGQPCQPGDPEAYLQVVPLLRHQLCDDVWSVVAHYVG